MRTADYSTRDFVKHKHGRREDNDGGMLVLSRSNSNCSPKKKHAKPTQTAPEKTWTHSKRTPKLDPHETEKCDSEALEVFLGS